MQEIVGTSRRYYFHSHIRRFPLHSIPRYSKIEPDLYVLEQRKENLYEATQKISSLSADTRPNAFPASHSSTGRIRSAARLCQQHYRQSIRQQQGDHHLEESQKRYFLTCEIQTGRRQMENPCQCQRYQIHPHFQQEISIN